MTPRNPSRILALFPGLLGIGGVQQAGRVIAAALSQIAASRDWEADFLSLNDPPGHQAFPWNGTEIRFRGFGRAKTRFAIAAIAAARRRAEITIAAHPNLALVAAQTKLWRPRLRTAVISHGVEVWRPLSPLRRRAFLDADILIAPSRYTLQQIIRVQGAPSEKAKLLPWPLDPAFLRMAAQNDPPSPPANFPNGLVVLTAARLAANEQYKGVDRLIRAVAELAPRLPSLQMVVAGSGDDLPRHQSLAAELRISDRVHFFQGLTPAEMAGCYSHCDLFALPSTGEGFGFVFLEAMAFGKPVIGAAAGGVTDIVGHGQNGLLVPAGDSARLVQSLESLLTSEQLRLELGREGAEIVRSKFRFEDFRFHLEEILSERPFI
jgi:glycosyltransferase involved in cell wall biosynthesis